LRNIQNVVFGQRSAQNGVCDYFTGGGGLYFLMAWLELVQDQISKGNELTSWNVGVLDGE